jgi:hypothetical protein
MLEEYLRAPLTPDDPPREQARKLLARATGEAAGKSGAGKRP